MNNSIAVFVGASTPCVPSHKSADEKKVVYGNTLTQTRTQTTNTHAIPIIRHTHTQINTRTTSYRCTKKLEFCGASYLRAKAKAWSSICSLQTITRSINHVQAEGIGINVVVCKRTPREETVRKRNQGKIDRTGQSNPHWGYRHHEPRDRYIEGHLRKRRERGQKKGNKKQRPHRRNRH